MIRKIGIIGTGRVGTALSRVFTRSGFETYVAGRTYQSSVESSRLSSAEPQTKEYIAKNADLILLAVQDSEIEKAASEIAPYLNEKQIVAHLSGALDCSNLAFLKSMKASVHPVKSFADPVTSAESFTGTILVCEGDDGALPSLRDVVKSIEGVFVQIRPEDKPKYHLALTIASNFSVLIADLSEELLLEAGFKEEDARPILLNLIEGTLSNMKNLGITKALTGPIERGDIATVKKHLSAIESPLFKEFYVDGSILLVDIAKKKSFVDNILWEKEDNLAKYEDIKKFLEEK
ncbi:MAG: Rossmann-like and DUF2520 domain-containing protein [Caldisericaceae bacterium]